MGNRTVGVHFITLSFIGKKFNNASTKKISMKYWHMHLIALKSWLQTSCRCSDRLALYFFFYLEYFTFPFHLATLYSSLGSQFPQGGLFWAHILAFITPCNASITTQFVLGQMHVITLQL